MRALVFGMALPVVAPTSALLSRAGLAVDVITSDEIMQSCQGISSCKVIQNSEELLDEVRDVLSKETYQLSIPTEDRILGLIINSQLNEELKAKMLPVTSLKYADHIYSKIVLSEILNKSLISTPDYWIVNNIEELIELDKKIEKPYLIKLDASGGGAGVFLVDLEGSTNLYLASRRLSFPVLIQKKVFGRLLDLSGFFYNGELIYFHCSEMLICRPTNFGLSILRRYYKSSKIGWGFCRDLMSLGRALGINGFANISAILSHSKNKLYFIEADVRPNVWVEHGVFIDEDPAESIRKYFVNNRLDYPAFNIAAEYAIDTYGSMEIPAYSRLSEEEINTNKYNCLSFKRDYFIK